VNIALVNELAMIFRRMNIDTHEVLAAAGIKWNFLPFKPGLVGGHCIGIDPYYRIDEHLKNEATTILATMGLTVSDFVRIALTKVVSEQGLPFEMRVPNRLTAETLAKSERGEDLHRAESADALFDELGI